MIITTNKQMRPRDPADYYPTPIEICRASLALLPNYADPNPEPFIIDPGAGDGVWGEAARERWPYAEISGCDIRDLPQPPAYDQWLPKWDFVHQAIGGGADLVIGNPPYKFAEEFVRKALRFTANGGYVLFLLRLAFLEGQSRGNGLWRESPPQSVHVLSARPSFTGDGKTDATAYAIYIWRKGWQGQTSLGWLDWKPSDDGQLSLF
jgi:hypothetical protein